jgi:hypothetical protein
MMQHVVIRTTQTDTNGDWNCGSRGDVAAMGGGGLALRKPPEAGGYCCSDGLPITRLLRVVQPRLLTNHPAWQFGSFYGRKLEEIKGNQRNSGEKGVGVCGARELA